MMVGRKRCGSKTVEPDFRVLECLNDAMSGPFVLSGVAVFQELLGDISLLLGSEKFDTRGVAVDEKIHGNRDDDS